MVVDTVVDQDMFISKMREEIMSAKSYFSLADKATSKSDYECFVAAGVDEYEHACFLYEMLADQVGFSSEELSSELNMLRKMKNTFRS